MNKIFISQIYYENIKNSGLTILNRSLLEDCERLQSADLSGKNWSQKNYPNGFTTYGSLDKLHQLGASFLDLQKLIDRHVHQYVKSLQYDVRPRQLIMTSCWFNQMGKNAIHTGHIHPLSFISGTYYLLVPKNSSAIKFEDPRLGFMMAAPAKKAKCSVENANFFRIQPKAGKVLLFESWMRHEVELNQSKDSRLSISFNYDWR